MVNRTVVMDGESTVYVHLDGELTALTYSDAAESGIVTKVREGELPAYTGPTEVTPSEEEQILDTANKSVMTPITINPIPQNYGLITRVGARIMVS